jgi:sulfate adenylyltransferase large subunit
MATTKQITGPIDPTASLAPLQYGAGPSDSLRSPLDHALRIATAGSVDDGKSTLIGRLLHDTKTIMEDQLAAVERASNRYGDGSFNLALLTDGLRAEREQGITIDVAYRYFATPRRRFILADSPGHVQYTRNMVTAASSADVAIVLVDAARGISPQTRRHAYIASLLGVSQIVVAVNKMDAANWDPVVFEAISTDLRTYLAKLDIPVPVLAIPVSALLGDNIADTSANTPWYSGPTLLAFLETFTVQAAPQAPARLDIQWTLRDYQSGYRGLAGRLSSGNLSVGDVVSVLPSGLKSTVAQIDRGGESLQTATPGQAISVVLADDIDASRGDVIVGLALAGSPSLPATSTTSVTVDVCWMTETPLSVGDRVWFKHTTRNGRATVTAIQHRVDVETLEHQSATTMELNDLGRVQLELSSPIFALPFAQHHESGRLILIDERTNTTAGAALIV